MNTRERDAAFHMRVYARADVVFVRGAGTRLWDDAGKEYLDFLAGIAVMSVGHAHPRVVAAIRDQAARLSHISNLFYNEPQARLAERLHNLLGWGKVFFTNSGAEANECALKLARRVAARRGDPRSMVVSAAGSFHGRTFATLGATGQPGKHEPFAPMPPWYRFVALNDEAGLDAAVDSTTAALLLEVLQGEGGIHAAETTYLQAARKLTDARDAVLIYDEVQTGLGRTGAWFAYEHHDVAPDIVTLAKALGGGLPIGACVAREDIADAFEPGDHATTFGGGPIPCAAALAVLDVIEDEGLVANAADVGAYLARLARQLPGVVEVRGSGLMLGVELDAADAGQVATAALGAGLIVGTAGPTVLRLTPPLTISNAECDHAVEVLATILASRETER